MRDNNLLVGLGMIAMGSLSVMVRKRAYFDSTKIFRKQEEPPSKGAELICLIQGVALITLGILVIFHLIPT